MLNQDLIKQFKHIKQHTLTGVLTLHDKDREIRFYFEEGSLLLLDFGVDKEMVIAEQFVKHYKIDNAMAQYAKTTYEEQQKPIAETLLKQQLVSQGEVDQVTRAMVEDLLCYSFSSSLSTAWQNESEVSIESFDLNKTAVKIRIDIDMLLTMVQSRIQEREAVEQRIENWDTVFSYAEGAPADSQLNEMEKNVLHFVDGRQSAKDIARSMRESNINIGIYLISLENQGFIKKGGVRQSTRIAVSQTTQSTGGGDAAAPQASSQATSNAPAQTSAPSDEDPFENDEPKKDDKNFEVYTASHVRKQQSSGLSTTILVIILLVVGGVGYLVYDGMQTQKEQERRYNELVASVSSSEWAQAEKLLKESYSLVEGDSVGIKRMDKIVLDIQSKLMDKIDAIETHIQSSDLPAAKEAIAAFPQGVEAKNYNQLWSTELINKLDVARRNVEDLDDSLQETALSMEESTRNLLRSGIDNIEIAIRQVEEQPDGISQNGWNIITEKSKSVIKRWRQDTLTEVEESGDRKTYKWKFNQLAYVKKALPTESETQRIIKMEQELKEEQMKLVQRLSDVPELLKSGDYVSAQKLLTLLEENNMALPEGKTGLVIEYMTKRNDLENAVKGHEDELRTAVVSSLEVKPIIDAAAQVKSDLATYEALPNREELDLLLASAQVAIDAGKNETLEEELEALQAIELDPQKHDVEILKRRIATTEIIVKSAANRLETIRKQSREGSLDEAIVSLNSFLSDTSFNRTVSMIEAKELLSALKERKAKNDKLYSEFIDAIMQDNVELVSKLLPQIEQQVLPFVVSSVPSGAKIYLNGKDTGKVTPQLYPPSTNAERAEMTFTLEKDGYRTATLSPLNAESSWRIRATMQRKPIAEANLKESLSSAVAVIDDAVWLSSNKSIWKINKDGSSTAYKLPNGVTTIFAPAMEADGSIYVASRDRVVVRIDKDETVTGIPASVSSEHALLHFISPVMLDSELLIMVDAASGDIHALNEIDQKVQWTFKGSDRAACSPILVNDQVIVLYRDGICKTIDANNGNEITSANIGNQVLSAWTEDDKIYAYTEKELHAWDGEEINTEPLFKTIVNGGPDVIKTKDNRIRTRNEDGRFDVELGRLPVELTGQPLLWNGHAVCPVGNVMHILGPHGFTIESSKPMLAPALFGDLLVVASSDGQVRLLKQ